MNIHEIAKRLDACEMEYARFCDSVGYGGRQQNHLTKQQESELFLRVDAIDGALREIYAFISSNKDARKAWIKHLNDDNDERTASEVFACIA